MKWGIPLAICALLFIVGVMGGVFYVMNNRADEPVQPEQTVSADTLLPEPQEITLPTKPTKPEVRDNDDEYMYPSSSRPMRTTTTTTTTTRPTTTTPSRTTTNNGNLTGTVNGLRNQKLDNADNKPLVDFND